MQRVHFIAIGGAEIHGLVIALSKKNNFQITGSDNVIDELIRNQLKTCGLMPEKLGWFPEKITNNLQAIVVGVEVLEDNPELIRAKELRLKIFSIPEYIFLQTRSKTRIVVGGSRGKTTTTAMILFVLKKMRIDTDYLIEEQIDGIDNLIKLSFESRIAVLVGDEFPTSAINVQPKFHLYKPHIAVLTGIEWSKSDTYRTLESYTQQFKKFTELMEVQGRLIYFEGDEQLKLIAQNLRRDIVPFAYNTPAYEVRNGIVFMKTKYGEIKLQFVGVQNLQYMDAARLACRQIGVTDEQFYSVISEFQWK